MPNKLKARLAEERWKGTVFNKIVIIYMSHFLTSLVGDDLLFAAATWEISFLLLF
jgi:hypothetical protein